MRLSPLALALALVLVPHTAALAKRQTPLEKAAELQEFGRFEEAASLYGKAVALAHSKGDLRAEDEIAGRIDTLFGVPVAQSVAGAPKSGAAAPQAKHRTLSAAILAELDPAHDGAIVCARTIARRLLFTATSRGDGEFVPEAAAVLARFASRKHAGVAGPALASYASGMVAVRSGRTEAAVTDLAKALDAAVEHGWAAVAWHVATELAAARLATEDEAGAASAIAAAADVVDNALEFQRWGFAIRKRLKDAPAEVVAAYNDAAPEPQAVGPPTDVGQVGLGDLGFGKAKTTPLGKAFKRLSKSKPLATVRRGATAFELTTFLDPKMVKRVPYPERSRDVDEGGLVLTFTATTVGLRRLRMDNPASQGLGRGGVIASNVANLAAVGAAPVRAQHLLGVGETWSVTKRGEVRVGE